MQKPSQHVPQIHVGGVAERRVKLKTYRTQCRCTVELGVLSKHFGRVSD
jgi:hypothetical protein